MNKTPQTHSSSPTSAPAISLSRDTTGQLVCQLANEEICQPVTPVQAFPLAAPWQYISLVNQAGHEVVMLAELGQLSSAQQQLLRDALAERNFTPVILRICAVNSYQTPSTWQVETDRGHTSLVLKGEEDIRRLSGNGLQITDSHGIFYKIPDRTALDRNSRKILKRFL